MGNSEWEDIYVGHLSKQKFKNIIMKVKILTKRIKFFKEFLYIKYIKTSRNNVIGSFDQLRIFQIWDQQLFWVVQSRNSVERFNGNSVSFSSLFLCFFNENLLSQIKTTLFMFLLKSIFSKPPIFLLYIYIYIYNFY